MMTQALSLVALAVVAFFPSAVMGQTTPIGVRVIFNRGVEDVNKTCTAADWDKVEQALDVGYARSQNRRLETGNDERQLMSIYCRRACLPYPQGMCWAAGCTGINRRLETPELFPAATTTSLSQMEEAPAVVDALECNEKQANILKAISLVLLGVNESCRKMIMANHWLKCYYGV